MTLPLPCMRGGQGLRITRLSNKTPLLGKPAPTSDLLHTQCGKGLHVHVFILHTFEGIRAKILTPSEPQLRTPLMPSRRRACAQGTNNEEHRDAQVLPTSALWEGVRTRGVGAADRMASQFYLRLVSRPTSTRTWSALPNFHFKTPSGNWWSMVSRRPVCQLEPTLRQVSELYKKE